MKKIVGIDYGQVRMGLAISDANRCIALPLHTLTCPKDPQKKLDTLMKYLATLDFEKVVIGLPLLLNGKDSSLTQEVRQFAALLEKTLKKPVVLWDERLTSKQAERLLIDSGMNRKKRAQKVDTLAATLILQSYLDIPQTLNP
ncbi:MAG: Holliday junction resolvase RuvX [Chlamydiae bacterium]|nr:Holliday junction resolvase RuvX [Chlamydiota bacterium]